LNLIRVMPAKGTLMGGASGGAFSMHIMINGTPHELGKPETVGHLLTSLEIVPERVAIMVNDRIIPKEERAGSELKEGDRVEILTFMGGG
jgi:sulfur carrier protein